MVYLLKMVIFHVKSPDGTAFLDLFSALQMDRSQASFSEPLEKWNHSIPHLTNLEHGTWPRTLLRNPSKYANYFEMFRANKKIQKTYQNHQKPSQKPMVFPVQTVTNGPSFFFSHGFDGWGFDEWSWAHSSPLQPQSLIGDTQTVP